MSSQKVSRRLIGENSTGLDLLACRFIVEVLQHVEYQRGEFAKESAIMTKEGPQQLGEGPDELPVR